MHIIKYVCGHAAQIYNAVENLYWCSSPAWAAGINGAFLSAYRRLL